MPDVKIKSLEGKEFGAYCAMPPGGNGPGLVVIQEIFGVNAAMRKICDDFAAKGYIAVCPDLFWRQQPGVQLTDKTPPEWDRAFELYKGFDVEAGVRDLLSALAYVRALKGCSGKVGSVGYCLGGKMAFLMATRSDVDASVSYYGVDLDKYLDEIHDIRMPLILHMAGLDKFMTGAVREKVLKAIQRNPVITAYVYEGVDHAFARPNGQNFNQAAADLANSRTVEFFAKNLQG
ncbi:MAG TPA: dienelactone hydrolase family protein [Alphaproteobacteria bacterium]|nr:dienelactone hydrolase family protein [Alphaproteobacteria bacterium]